MSGTSDLIIEGFQNGENDLSGRPYDDFDCEVDSDVFLASSSFTGKTDAYFGSASCKGTNEIKRNLNSELSVREYQILREFSKYSRDGGDTFKFYSKAELIDLISISLCLENSLVRNITEKLISLGYLSRCTLLTNKAVKELVDWDPTFVFHY